jgi:hypothetical protein
MAESAHKKILRACYAVLVPIARTLLRAGINYREFDELARLAFVRVAGDEYGLRGRPTNISRIAAMTGLARKEVSRIRQERQTLELQPRTELSPLGDVLHYWHTDPIFLDDRGLPLRLPFDGSSPSFTDLVRRCAGDLPAGAIKVELMRTGAVAQDPKGTLRVLKRVAVPESVDDRLITSLSFNLFCLASTIAYNSNPSRKGKGRIERFVQSEGVSEASRARIRLIARRRIERFTEELDDLFSAVKEGKVEDSHRVGIGVYYYEDDDP